MLLGDAMPSQEEINEQLRFLAAHRRTLAGYLHQQAALGRSYVPPGVLNGINEARTSIRRIKDILRGWSVRVDDHPDDEEGTEVSYPPPVPQLLPQAKKVWPLRRDLMWFGVASIVILFVVLGLRSLPSDNPQPSWSTSSSIAVSEIPTENAMGIASLPTGTTSRPTNIIRPTVATVAPSTAALPAIEHVPSATLQPPDVVPTSSIPPKSEPTSSSPTPADPTSPAVSATAPVPPLPTNAPPLSPSAQFTGCKFHMDILLRNPFGIAIKGDTIYVTDMGDNKVYMFGSNGTVEWGKPGDPVQFNDPKGIAVDWQGNVYVADSGNHQIQKLNHNNGKWEVFWDGDKDRQPGDKERQLWGVAADNEGNVYITDQMNQEFLKLSSEGTKLPFWNKPGAESGRFQGPTGIAVDNDKNVYVVDNSNDKRLRVFDSNGTEHNPIDFPDSGLYTGIGVDSNRTVYVAATGQNSIQVFDKDGNPLPSWDTAAGTSLNQPRGVAVDGDGNVYVTDTDKSRIVVFQKDSCA
jgi:sugar lactone lactonase YvrE